MSVPRSPGLVSLDLIAAEVKIVGAAEKLGVRVDAISASHRICKDCQAALRTHNPNIKYQSALR